MGQQKAKLTSYSETLDRLLDAQGLQRYCVCAMWCVKLSPSLQQIVNICIVFAPTTVCTDGLIYLCSCV